MVSMKLMEKIEERLAATMARNPTRVDLCERYQGIVQKYNKDRRSTTGARRRWRKRR
jgi:type I restriction enzyme R subunit